MSSTIDELFEASRTGSVEEVKCLLRGGIDPNGMFGSGLTSLHIAARKGHLSVVELLVENGADPNVRTVKRADIPFLHFRDSGLHFAAEEAHPAVVEYLLRNGAEVDARNSEGLTALHLAVMNTLGLKPQEVVLTVVRLLLESGANINRRSRNGLTPLDRAQYKSDVAAFLRSRGAKHSWEFGVRAWLQWLLAR